MQGIRQSRQGRGGLSGACGPEPTSSDTRGRVGSGLAARTCGGEARREQGCGVGRKEEKLTGGSHPLVARAVGRG